MITNTKACGTVGCIPLRPLRAASLTHAGIRGWMKQWSWKQSSPVAASGMKSSPSRPPLLGARTPQGLSNSAAQPFDTRKLVMSLKRLLGKPVEPTQ